MHKNSFKYYFSFYFFRLHIWFTWLLSVGAKRLEEFSPPRLLNNAYNDSKKRGMTMHCLQ